MLYWNGNQRGFFDRTVFDRLRKIFSSVGIFLTQRFRGKIALFFKNYGLDCWVNPYKTFSTWSHIERVRSLRGILAWNWHSWAHTLWSIRICVFIFLCICVFFLCICLFLSVFLTFYMSYSSSRAGHSHSNLKSGKSFLNSWKLGRSESQPTRLHITLASNLDRMKRIEKDFEKLK